MDPEEFRRFGHQIVDWIADYRARVAAAPRHVPRGARLDPGAAPRFAARRARGLRGDPRRPRPGRRARPLALAAPALLRLLPLERRALVGARRLPQHRPRRPRPLVAVEPGADRDRGGHDRLGAADDRPLRRVERRHPGHGLDLHAGRARLRARAGLGLLARARRAAGRGAAARRLRLGRTATARSTRRRCWPASAATTCASVAHDERYAMRPDALDEAIRADLAARPQPCAVVATTGTTTTTAIDPDRRRRRGRAPPRPLAARRRGDGRLGHDPARVPLAVGGHRGRRLARPQPAQVARARPSTARSTTCATPSTSCA